MNPLRGEIINVTALSSKDFSQMFGLMSHYYDNLLQDTFLSDLQQKDCVLALFDRKKDIVGFSTQKLITFPLDNQEIRGIFSGDTIVDKTYWGQMELARLWLQYVLQVGNPYDYTNFYWFLISKGLKTYRMLPVHFHTYYPNHALPTPPYFKKLLDTFGTCFYPQYYDREAGVMRYHGQKDRLKAEIVEMDKRKSGEVRDFFESVNPNYKEGDDLVCVAPINPHNFKPRVRAITAQFTTC